MDKIFLCHSISTFFEFSSSLLLEYGHKSVSRYLYACSKKTSFLQFENITAL